MTSKEKNSKKYVVVVVTAVLLVTTIWSWSVQAAGTMRFQEMYSSVPRTAFGFPLNHSLQYRVNSSWNEPRAKENHPGIDSYGDRTHYVYPLANNAFVEDKGWSDTGGNFVVLKYNINNSIVYSLYMHLDRINPAITKGSIISSRNTWVGVVGNTGCGDCGPHLHWEVLSSYSSLDSRISVSPNNFDWGNAQFSDDAAVFKRVDYHSASRTLYVRAYDTDVGKRVPVNPYIIFKPTSSTQWNVAQMTVVSSSTFDYKYTFPYSGTTVDVMLAGRRNNSEYWSYYPAKYTNLNNSSNPLPSLTDSKLTLYVP